MNEEQEQHLEDIKYEFTRLVDAKYRAGQREHGGELWRKRGLINMAIEEVIDQVVYLITLRDQLNGWGIDVGDKDEA